MEIFYYFRYLDIFFSTDIFEIFPKTESPIAPTTAMFRGPINLNENNKSSSFWKKKKRWLLHLDPRELEKEICPKLKLFSCPYLRLRDRMIKQIKVCGKNSVPLADF